MEQAILKAIEGGWKPKYWSTDGEINDVRNAPKVWYSDFREDPLFWQALGKGCKWIEDERKYGTLKWHYEAMRFMEHLMMGKTVESFFKELFK